MGTGRVELVERQDIIAITQKAAQAIGAILKVKKFTCKTWKVPLHQDTSEITVFM